MWTECAEIACWMGKTGVRLVVACIVCDFFPQVETFANRKKIENSSEKKGPARCSFGVLLVQRD